MINYKEKFEELRKLNIKVMIKEISIATFVEMLYEMDEQIEKEIMEAFKNKKKGPGRKTLLKDKVRYK